jgi:hypothetical protein
VFGGESQGTWSCKASEVVGFPAAQFGSMVAAVVVSVFAFRVAPSVCVVGVVAELHRFSTALRVAPSRQSHKSCTVACAVAGAKQELQLRDAWSKSCTFACVVAVAKTPNPTLHLTRPPDLFPDASLLVVVVTGVSAGPVSLMFGHRTCFRNGAHNAPSHP